MSSLPSAARPRRIVVKLGTGVLTTGIGQLDTSRITGIARELAALHAQGTEVVVVSSGAVGLGMGALKLAKRPKDVWKKQACAAIGQSRLMQTWQEAFSPHDLTVAQVLLTREDLRARDRYLGIKRCLDQLIAYGTVPIINENDTVSAAEIEAILKFGDNDTLSAMVASLIEAQYLIILSTAPGLIDMQGTKEIVPVVERITPEIEAMAGGTTSETATGGMISKISAAKLATRAGCGVFIGSGAEPDIVSKLLGGKGPGTFFVPSGLPLEARKRWMAYFQRPAGTVRVNARAIPAIREQGRSLLAVGVVEALGDFEAGDIVNIEGPGVGVFGRGKVGYSQRELQSVAGLQSEALAKVHPARKRLEVVHRNDLVLL